MQPRHSEPDALNGLLPDRQALLRLRAQIEARLGFFPPFFVSAEEDPQTLSSLWHQTLDAYLDSRLPALFCERLSAYLSRFCAVPYCMICHSCCLRPWECEPPRC